MKNQKPSFWKILGLFGFISGWAAESLAPDADGKIRLGINELSSLAEGVCLVFGWDAEITMPDSDKAA